MNKPSPRRRRPPPRSHPSPATEPQGGMGSAAGRGERADSERPHLAALPHRWQGEARSGRGDAGRRPAQRRRGGSRGRAGCPARHSGDRLLPLYRAASQGRAGSEAFNEGNLVCQACRAVKREFPELGLVTDVALDPYTSHGHDGLVRESASGELTILNDENGGSAGPPGALIRAGRRRRHRASDMMDGRVGAIRAALDAEGFLDVQIMAYAAEYCFRLHGRSRRRSAQGRALRATSAPTRWTQPTATRRCARSSSTSTRARTWSWSSRACPISTSSRRVKDEFRGPDLRLSGQRRIFDDHGRRPERLDRRRQGDDGEPHRLQARRRRRGAHLLRGARGGEAEEGLERA